MLKINFLQFSLGWDLSSGYALLWQLNFINLILFLYIFLIFFLIFERVSRSNAAHSL